MPLKKKEACAEASFLDGLAWVVVGMLRRGVRESAGLLGEPRYSVVWIHDASSQDRNHPKISVRVERWRGGRCVGERFTEKLVIPATQVK